MNQNTRVGASGFVYEDWSGSELPDPAKLEQTLQYYASDLGFDIIELNHTHQTMPEAESMAGLIEHVPEEFGFAPKLHSSLTQRIRESDGSFIRDESAISSYRRGISPLIELDMLLCVLAQFPIKFKRSPGAEEHLKWLGDALGGINLVVELPDPSWMAQSVFDMLRVHGIGYCIMDGPELMRLAPFNPIVTTDLAYVRLHGRNINWFNVTSNERYDYLYSDQELREFLEPLRQLGGKADNTVMFFNNYNNGSSLKNAIHMKRLIGEPIIKNNDDAE